MNTLLNSIRMLTQLTLKENIKRINWDMPSTVQARWTADQHFKVVTLHQGNNYSKLISLSQGAISLKLLGGKLAPKLVNIVLRKELLRL